MKILLLFVWMYAVPFFIGVLINFVLPKEKRTAGVTFLLGMLVYLAVFEVIAITCMLSFTYSAFMYCRRTFMAVSLVLALLGAVRGVYCIGIIWNEHPLNKNNKDNTYGEIGNDAKIIMYATKFFGEGVHTISRGRRIGYIIFIVLVTVQMVLSVVMSSFDGDDAYYVVESLLAQQADVMNTILPYIGTSTALDIRHALAVITMFIAYIATAGGVHATIVSHAVMPLLFIPLVYLVYYQIAKILFKKRTEIIPIFMIFIATLFAFGNVSIYTPATFFLMRTWQGKALVANLVIPLIFWIFLWLYESITDGGLDDSKEPAIDHGNDSNRLQNAAPWILLTLTNMVSGMCSSLGVIFGTGLIAVLTLLYMGMRLHNIVSGADDSANAMPKVSGGSRIRYVLAPALWAFLSIIPNIIYLWLYFSL